MRKRVITFAAAGFMALAMSVTAFAGEWKKDGTEWWYDNGDGTYPAKCWKWIDGNEDGTAECYYFNEKGYMLAACTTPDGYTVTENGQWIKEGAIQTKSAESIQDQSKYLASTEPWGTTYYLSTPDTSTDSKGVSYIKPLVIACSEDKGNCYCEYECSGYVRLKADKIALGNVRNKTLPSQVVVNVYDALTNKVLQTVTLTPDSEDASLDVSIVGKTRINISARVTSGSGSSANVIFDNLRLVK